MEKWSFISRINVKTKFSLMKQNWIETRIHKKKKKNSEWSYVERSFMAPMEFVWSLWEIYILKKNFFSGWLCEMIDIPEYKKISFRHCLLCTIFSCMFNALRGPLVTDVLVLEEQNFSLSLGYSVKKDSD